MQCLESVGLFISVYIYLYVFLFVCFLQDRSITTELQKSVCVRENWQAEPLCDLVIIFQYLPFS